jgi:hypothetical protein
MRELQLILYEIGCTLFRSFRGRVMQRFGGFFLLDSQTLTKISMACALRLPTSKPIGN